MICCLLAALALGPFGFLLSPFRPKPAKGAPGASNCHVSSCSHWKVVLPASLVVLAGVAIGAGALMAREPVTFRHICIFGAANSKHL